MTTRGAGVRTCHQMALLERREGLTMFYWRGPGDGRRLEDWTVERRRGAPLDYMEAAGMADGLRDLYGVSVYAAVLPALDEQADAGAGALFFARRHRDRDEEAVASVRGRGAAAGTFASHSMPREGDDE